MRINRVKKARKDQGNCSGCGKPVKKGDGYKWIKSRFGPRKIKCDECRFRPSELTSSKMGAIWDAQEDTREAIAGWDGEDVQDLKSILEEFAEVVREVGQEYSEAADNMPENLQYSPVAEECREKGEELEGWASDLECFDFDEFDEPDKDELREEHRPAGESAANDLKKDQTIEERDKFIEEYIDDAVEGDILEKKEEWMDEQRGNAESEIDNCPC
jgi:hypothetical protein